jgi:hypothetical protein
MGGAKTGIFRDSKNLDNFFLHVQEACMHVRAKLLPKIKNM